MICDFCFGYEEFVPREVVAQFLMRHFVISIFLMSRPGVLMGRLVKLLYRGGYKDILRRLKTLVINDCLYIKA